MAKLPKSWPPEAATVHWARSGRRCDWCDEEIEQGDEVVIFQGKILHEACEQKRGGSSDG